MSTGCAEAVLGRLAALAALSAAAAAGSAAPVPPPTPREFRGVWVATVTNIDWPTSATTNATTLQTSLRAILDRAVSMRTNAIVFQVRPACDAFYQSSLEPWSRYLTGTEGVAPSGGFDPLAFAIAEAHARGLELHAWFNPFRAERGTYAHAASHVSNTHPEWVVSYAGDLWLDPGIQAAQDWTYGVILDVVNRYDIDAVHMDDYFYPYPDGTPFPDSATFAAYQQSGGTLSLSNWRRDNINRIIQRLNTGIHQAKPRVRFGLSPFGIWRPGNPPGVTGLDAYASLYADSRLWLNQGWVDYMAPQLYWVIDSAGQPFEPLLDWWVSQNLASRHVWPGLFTGRVGTGGTPLWPVSEIVNQIAITRETPGATGHIHFSERAFRNNWGGIVTALGQQTYTADALVPATTWLDALPPAAPNLTVTFPAPASPVTMTWSPGDAETPWLWAVHILNGGTWTHDVVPGSQTSLVIPGSANPPEAVAVSAVDRVSNESGRTVRDLETPLGLLTR